MFRPTILPGQRGLPGWELAREVMYGSDAREAESPEDLRAFLLTAAQDVREVVEHAYTVLEDQIDTPEHRQALTGVVATLGSAATRLSEICKVLTNRDVMRPFRIVLMGRTQAGKSTLFEYLSAGDGTRIGDGRQRVTRDACARPTVELGIEIVDTPGVGALDGQEDYDTAFGQVADADLILWVATDQATQEQTGQALERLSDLGKPILVALNCKADVVTDEIGLLDMLEEPERIFGGDAEGNLAAIRRHLERAGGRYLDAVSIHAQAARHATTGALSVSESEILHDHSRIETLLDALRHQRDRTADQRRLVSLTDVLRIELLAIIVDVNQAYAVARAAHIARIGVERDFSARALRRIADAHDELTSTFEAAVANRERWVEDVDVDQKVEAINQEWEDAVNSMRASLDCEVGEICRRLQSDLSQIALEVADDWATFEVGVFSELGGRGSIVGNLTVKVAGRVAAGLGTAAIGFKIGALVGTGVGPGVGTAIGAAVGTVIGLVAGLLGLNRLIDWVADSLFRSAPHVRESRRTKVRDQFSPLLETLRKDLDAAGERMRREWVDAIERDLAQHGEVSTSIDRSLAEVERLAADKYEPVVARVEAELARSLLRSMGRARAASALTRATRLRGAGMVITVPEPVFSELVLFPLPDTVETIVPTRDSSSSAADALQIVRSLTEHQVVLNRMTHDCLEITLDSRVAPGTREAWEALARLHAGADVRLTVMSEGDAP